MTPELLESWLVLQCQAIPGVHVAYARFGLAEAEDIEASWPAAASPETAISDMLSMARHSRGPVVSRPSADLGSQDTLLRIARPLQVAEQVVGAVVVEISAKGTEQQEAVMRLLQWGNTWLELLSNSESGEVGESTLSSVLLGALRAPSFQQAAMTVVAILAQDLKFERVSLGLRKSQGNQQIHLIALSGSAEISPNGDLAVRIGDAMSQLLQRIENGDDTSSDASTQSQFCCALESRLGNYGALSFETRSEVPVSDAQVRSAREAAAVLGPLLALRREAEQPVLRRWFKQSLHRTRTFMDTRPILRTGAWLCAVLLLATYLWLPANHRVSGPAELQGEVQRAVIAPFDGYVVKANARAGERIKAGAVLAELDDTDLRIEHRQLEGDKAELEKQFNKALAALDHAQARILKAQVKQADARIELLGLQLMRTRLTVPFDAVVVEGDLSRSLGKPVERGEVLFEIAPLNGYRVVAEIKDQDVSELRSGQQGQLILAALPQQRLSVEVVNITRSPDAKLRAGTFGVESRLLSSTDLLRPGMRGVVKIQVGKRSRWWIYTHELADWMRLKLWAWLP